MIIDAKNLILGRVATLAAKQALLGETVHIVNCDFAVITGKKRMILNRYKAKIERGDPHHGPFFPKETGRIVRRTVRGMLPFRQDRGREAYRRVKCYVGVPSKFKNEKLETIENAHIKKVTDTNFITVKELSGELK